MTEFIGLLVGVFIVLEREWLFDTFFPERLAPRADNDPDWIHSVTKKYADPIDDYRAGYIDRYEYVGRETALKKYITYDALIGPAFANYERVVRDLAQ